MHPSAILSIEIFIILCYIIYHKMYITYMIYYNIVLIIVALLLLVHMTDMSQREELHITIEILRACIILVVKTRIH